MHALIVVLLLAIILGIVWLAGNQYKLSNEIHEELKGARDQLYEIHKLVGEIRRIV